MYPHMYKRKEKEGTGIVIKQMGCEMTVNSTCSLLSHEKYNVTHLRFMVRMGTVSLVKRNYVLVSLRH